MAKEGLRIGTEREGANGVNHVRDGLVLSDGAQTPGTVPTGTYALEKNVRGKTSSPNP